MFPITANVTVLRGVGPVYANALAVAEIFTLKDLLWSLPYRYIDRGSLHKISDFSGCKDFDNKKNVTILCTIKVICRRNTSFERMSLVEAVVGDDTGTLRIVWFNQSYINNLLKIGDQLLLSGPLAIGRCGLELRGPTFELVGRNSDSSWTGRYLPLYRKIGPITGRTRKRLVKDAISSVIEPEEWLPVELARNELGTMTSLAFLHQPPDDSSFTDLDTRTTRAHRRLVIEELFAFSLGLTMRRASLAVRHGHVIPTTSELREKLKSYLPFRLTRAQRMTFREIVSDLTSGRVMQRLLQGDVGSGKTLVAFLTMAMIAETGGQSAIMVPTEVLARQHAETIQLLLKNGTSRIQMLLGNMKAADRRLALTRIASGEASYIIGTHALFQETVTFSRLQLVVVDEQHRFGVRQREAIKQKGVDPHWLVMSATPIPRSLALAIFGDLDQSIIDELPPGRQPIVTKLIDPAHIECAWTIVDNELKAGHQIFVVSPAIDLQDETKSRLRNLEAMEKIINERFPSYKLAVVHGRLNSREMAERMESFMVGRVDILLATTVIEVGVNIPNATVMVVDNAEHFGLSQLHQLRGRVGRGNSPSHFLMLSSSETERLLIMTKTQDGFLIAHKDLELRGPGEFFGTRQAGLPKFQVADLLRDRQLLLKCRELADQTLKRGLSEQQKSWLKQEQARLKLFDVS